MTKLKILGFTLSFLIIVLGLALIMNLLLFNYGLQNFTTKFFDGNKVVIKPLAAEKLAEIYTDDLEVEIPVCLAGRIDTEEGTITIEQVFEPEIFSQNESSVSFVRCPFFVTIYQNLGTLHNHINGNCQLSPKDLQTYAADLAVGQSIIGLDCDEGYIFYILNRLESEVLTT